MDNYSPQVTQEDRTLAMVAHLLGLFTNCIGPLVIYLIKKDSKFVAFHALQEVFLQLAAAVLAGVLVITVVGAVLAPFIGLAVLILVIIACVKSYGGEWYEYPLIGQWARNIVGS